MKTFLSLFSSVIELIQTIQKRYGGTYKAGIYAAFFVLIFFELTFICFSLFFGEKSSAESKGYIEAIVSIQQRNLLEHAKDRLQICIDTSENNLILKTRYCKSAVEIYQDILLTKYTANTATQAYYQEKINIAAYSEMMNDVRQELRHLEFVKWQETPKSLSQNLFTWSLKGSVLSCLMVLCLLVMFSAYVYFSKKPKKTTRRLVRKLDRRK